MPRICLFFFYDLVSGFSRRNAETMRSIQADRRENMTLHRHQSTQPCGPFYRSIQTGGCTQIGGDRKPRLKGRAKRLCNYEWIVGLYAWLNVNCISENTSRGGSSASTPPSYPRRRNNAVRVRPVDKPYLRSERSRNWGACRMGANPDDTHYGAGYRRGAQPSRKGTCADLIGGCCTASPPASLQNRRATIEMRGAIMVLPIKSAAATPRSLLLWSPCSTIRL